MNGRILHGTVVEIDSWGAQLIETDAPETHLKQIWLCAYDRAQGVKVGDAVKLEYRTDRRSGLWYGSKA